MLEQPNRVSASSTLQARTHCNTYERKKVDVVKGGNQTADTGVPGGGGDSDSELEMHQPFGQFVTRLVLLGEQPLADGHLVVLDGRQATGALVLHLERSASCQPPAFKVGTLLEGTRKARASRFEWQVLFHFVGTSRLVTNCPKGWCISSWLTELPLPSGTRRSAVVGYPPSRRPLFMF